MMKEMTLDEAKKIREEWDRQFEAEMKELDDICRQEGYEQGKQDAEILFVRKMHEQGFSDDVIAKCTDLSLEEVKRLLQ